VLDIVHALAELHNEGPHRDILLLQICLEFIGCLACLKPGSRSEKESMHEASKIAQVMLPIKNTSKPLD